MDRRICRALALVTAGLGLLLLGTGCRNLRAPEIPPEPPYYSTGAAEAPAVGFSSQPASVNPYGATTPNGGLGEMSYGADPASSGQPGGGSYGNYAGSAYSPSVGVPTAGPDLPAPAPLQALPGSSLAEPAGMPSGY